MAMATTSAAKSIKEPLVQKALLPNPLPPQSNVTEAIAAKLSRDLHLQPSHPLQIIRQRIESFLPTFSTFSSLSPVVSTEHNFDHLLVPKDHVSRSKHDTYYIDQERCLRTHTSAHQTTLLGQGEREFLVSGDVYRRDTIDASHYPVFHQMEGVRVFDRTDHVDVEEHLKSTLDTLVKQLFEDPQLQTRWVDAYFPFTDPSFELEILFQDQWLEVLGCGVIEPGILKNAGLNPSEHHGWAFGLGLERLAMVLFDIPDIRLFWSQDPRFVSQFEEGRISKFLPFSKYPPCTKDISFWCSAADAVHENDVHDIVRSCAGDLVEQVTVVDEFTHPKSGRLSKCFRIVYRSMERSLTNEEIDELQFRVRSEVESSLGVELR